jgi:hypothetical protein
MKWLRSILGVAVGVTNTIANGTSPKQLLLSILFAALGIVTHVTSKDGTT